MKNESKKQMNLLQRVSIRTPVPRERAMESCRAMLEAMPTYQGFWVMGERGGPVLVCLDPVCDDDPSRRWLVRTMPRKPLDDFEGLRRTEPPADHEAWMFFYEVGDEYPRRLWSGGACWIAEDMAVFQVGIRNPTFIKVRVPPEASAACTPPEIAASTEGAA
ncbi:MAG: hypothetical protein JST16_18620 [Bdellovibrionales bacterium]|nr:hypothetical protein [Bdellovibrionales bacterium]